MSTALKKPPENLRKVVFIPFDSNPYQRELAEGLEKEGFKVHMAKAGGLMPMMKVLKETGPVDIIHVHWTHPLVISQSKAKSLIKSLLFRLQIIRCRMKGSKFVWTIHNLVNHEKIAADSEKKSNMFLFNNAGAVIVHSESARKQVIDFYGLDEKKSEKIIIIPHGNYVNTYENTVTREEAREYFGIEESKKVFLFLGNVRPYKGVTELIDAFKKVKNDEIFLLIGGRPQSNDFKNQVEKMIKEDTRIKADVGFIENEKMQHYLNAADVVVLPYREFLTSGALLMAMSFKKTVIAPRIGCFPELAGDGGSLLYDPADKDALQKIIEEASKREIQEFTQMGMINYEKVEEYGWEKVASMTADAYRSIL